MNNVLNGGERITCIVILFSGDDVDDVEYDDDDGGDNNSSTKEFRMAMYVLNVRAFECVVDFYVSL